MYKIPAKTLFVGKNIVFVPECHSTNSLALEISQKRDLAEGTIIITDHQKQGRGQQGNFWIAEQGKNLTFSVVLKPVFLTIKDQFQLNMTISMAIKDFLETQLGRQVYIKWPNDIIVSDRKISGLLIENHIQGNVFLHSIVGIGLNVNQQNYPIKHAASMHMLLGLEYDLQEVLEELCISLEHRYLELRQGRVDQLRAAYHASLYGIDEPRNFMDDNGHLEGIIKGVDEYGRLVMETSSGIRHFNNRELKFRY